MQCPDCILISNHMGYVPYTQMTQSMALERLYTLQPPSRKPLRLSPLASVSTPHPILHTYGGKLEYPTWDPVRW